MRSVDAEIGVLAAAGEAVGRIESPRWRDSGASAAVPSQPRAETGDHDDGRRAGAVIDERDEERRLVGRMLRGDERAFEHFFADTFDPLYRFALKRTGGDAEAAEEVVQRTMCAAINALAGWRGEARLLTWLCAICRNEIAGYFRRRGRETVRVELSEELPEVRAALETLFLGHRDPERDTLRQEVVDLVHVALDSLPARYGRALEWKYLEGESMKEIAGRFGTTPKAVESMLTRARSALREALEALLRGAAVIGIEGGGRGPA